jgi:hypothetical protein
MDYLLIKSFHLFGQTAWHNNDNKTHVVGNINMRLEMLANMGDNLVPFLQHGHVQWSQAPTIPSLYDLLVQHCPKPTQIIRLDGSKCVS